MPACSSGRSGAAWRGRGSRCSTSSTPALGAARAGRRTERSGEALVAYLDGELDPAEQRHVEAWLDADPAIRERLAALATSVDLVRSAYADIVDEPLPERLLAAARGEAAVPGTALQGEVREAEIHVLRPRRVAEKAPGRRWYIGLAAAAGLFGMMIGGAGTYLGMGITPKSTGADQTQLAT